MALRTLPKMDGKGKFIFNKKKISLQYVLRNDDMVILGKIFHDSVF